MATIKNLDTENSSVELTLNEEEVKLLQETVEKEGRMPTYLVVNVHKKAAK